MTANIILVGFIGAGKSSVGRILARRLGRCFVETDEMIAGREGVSVPDILPRPAGARPTSAASRRRCSADPAQAGRGHRHRRRAAVPGGAAGGAPRPRHRGMARRGLRHPVRPGPSRRRAANADRADDEEVAALYRARAPYYSQAHLTVDTTASAPTRWRAGCSPPCVGRRPRRRERSVPAPLLTRLGERPLLGDGAMGTMLYGRGVSLDACFDVLNLNSPSSSSPSTPSTSRPAPTSSRPTPSARTASSSACTGSTARCARSTCAG